MTDENIVSAKGRFIETARGHDTGSGQSSDILNQKPQTVAISPRCALSQYATKTLRIKYVGNANIYIYIYIYI